MEEETKEEVIELNPKQQRFCELYATKEEFFGNGVQSYIAAYNPDKSKPNWYQTARAVAYELLTKPHILTRINELIDASGLNDAFIDKQLYIVATQNADFIAKVKAINEYNKLKSRITDKVDHTSKGKQIVVEPLVVPTINPRNYADAETETEPSP